MRVIACTVLVLLLGLSQPAISVASDDNGGSINANEGEDDTVEGTPKRLGRKKKVQGGKVYASYGLSPHATAPKRVVEYSKSAVKVASTSAPTKAQSSKQKAVNQGVELPTPGCQAKVDFRPYMSDVEDQSQSNSCAANAVAGAYEYLAKRASLTRDGEEMVGEISRLFIYYDEFLDMQELFDGSLLNRRRMLYTMGTEIRRWVKKAKNRWWYSSSNESKDTQATEL
jgi:hypothetical protein